MPLAFELAAAWVRALSPQQIAARLGNRFRLLDGSWAGTPAGVTLSAAKMHRTGWPGR